MVYALDTSIIIDFLNRESTVVEQFNLAVNSGISIVIPSIVDYEVLRGFCYAASIRKEAVYSNIRTNCPIIEINASIWKYATSLYVNQEQLSERLIYS